MYSPTFSLLINFDGLSRRNKPTSSQISVPSKLPIVTSTNVSSPFLTQVPFLNQCKNSDHCKNFGFKTVSTSTQNDDLNAFENDMYDMIRNIEFTNIRNEFLDYLNKDIESIRSSKNRLVFADKSTNLYEYLVRITRSYSMST